MLFLLDRLHYIYQANVTFIITIKMSKVTQFVIYASVFHFTFNIVFIFCHHHR